MMRKALFVFILLAVFSFATLRATAFAAADTKSNSGVIKDNYIVVLKNDVKESKGVADELAKAHGFSVKHAYTKAIKGFSASMTADKLEKVKADTRVLYVAEDRQVSINGKPTNPGTGKPPKTTPTPTPTATPTPTPTPTPSPLWIRVTAPNGGETLKVGDTYRITWDSPPAIDNILIGYSSCDSCLDWIVFGTPNTGYYDWTVNVGNTTNTQFKINVIGYDTGVGSVEDYSDTYFTVLQPVTPTPTPNPTATPTPFPTPTPMPGQTTPTGISRVKATPTASAPGVTVAILDTGIDLTHPDLAANIVATRSCVTSEPTVVDGHGHGSHVAGTIGAINNTQGVLGVVPTVGLAAVKVLDKNGSGSWSEIICGIDWVTANASTYNIKVANMSLGGTGTSDNACGTTNNDPLHQAICNSTNAGVTYVVAAGNEADNAANHVPAAYDDTVITVSALADYDGKSGGLYVLSSPQGTTTQSTTKSVDGGGPPNYGPDDTFATFSNYGSVVDIGAPGISIYSTYKNGGYTYMSGTSMATPHVSAAAALYHATHVGATWTETKNALRSLGETLNNGHTDPSGLHPEPVLQVSGL